MRLLAVADLGTAEADGSNEASEMPGSLATTRRLAAEAESGRWQLLVHHGDIRCDVGTEGLGPGLAPGQHVARPVLVQ